MASIFDFFPGMGGGMGGGFPGHGHEDESDEEDSGNDKYYEILGIAKTATEDDIKKAYRKKARTLHPDRHPNEREKYNELFHELQAAYEVLSDSHKRGIYDKYGEKGLKHAGGGGAGNMDDIISQFFGGGGGGGRRRPDMGRKKSPPIKKVIDVTLEDLYKGSLKKIKIKRHTASADTEECSKCNGSGQITMIKRMGPMMLQQRTHCPQCNGQGYELSSEEEMIDIRIPPGGRHGESITVNGEGNKYPGHESGDILVTLRQAKHKTFTRRGADLGMNYTLTLKQALCGYRIKINHVSGHKLIVTSPKGEIVQPNALKRVVSQGMPIRFRAHTSGHLYIAMDIQMPLSQSLSDSTVEQFRKILPDIERSDDDDDDDQELEEKSNKNTKKKPKTKNQDDDGEDDGENDGEYDDEDEEEDYVEEVEATNVEDNPPATPASAKSSYDEDDEHHQTQCKQM